MTDTTDFGDYDQAFQAVVDGLKAQCIDTSQPLAVSVDLGFYSQQAACQAAAELVLTGYSAVSIAQTGRTPIPTLQVTTWTTTVTANMAPTLDALRSLHLDLSQFAAARGGKWAGAGVGPVTTETHNWGTFDFGQATDDQADQQLFDTLFAYNADMKLATACTAALRFSAEDAARQGAAALLSAGYLEVSIAPGDSGSIVEVVTYLVPKLEAIRTFRINFTKYAESRGGSWAGCQAVLAMPKGFDEQPS